MNYQNEQVEWSNFIFENLGQDVNLLSVSVSSSDCRVYQSRDSIFKIRKLTPSSVRGRLNSLEDEFLILKSLAALAEIPKAKRYVRQGLWELLEMTACPAIPIHDPTLVNPREKLMDFIRLAKLVLKLNRYGCSHGDFHFYNAGVNVEKGISLFDFDQAQLAHPIHCFVRDFLGIGRYARPDDISLLKRSKNVEYIWPIVKSLVVLKKLGLHTIRLFQKKPLKSSVAPLGLQARAAITEDQNLVRLAAAWDVAAGSNASSPGIAHAYYSIDIDGINFPGERPWVLRWQNISNCVNFNNKRFLELGCNMGLLATHAKMNGAAECLGLDVDSDILRAAKMVANAFDVAVNFQQHNLDDPRTWESDFSDYDIVSALSVMYWVKDKQRLWNFLGRHQELIYEGHEPDSVAERNLKNAGFNSIQKIGFSERGRSLFYANKDTGAALEH